MPRAALQADGFLRHWLVLGSFPGSPSLLAGKSFFPEERELPDPGKKQAGLKWTALKTREKVVDLTKLTPFWEHHVQCCGYAHAYVHAKKGGQAFLSLGSDDGAVVWLNGACIFSLDTQRGTLLDQDRVTVNLQSGWNRLLVKALQYGGEWSFALRFLDLHGQPYPGLSASADKPAGSTWPDAGTSYPVSLYTESPTPLACATADPSAPFPFHLRLQNLGTKRLEGAQVEVRDGRGTVLETLACPALDSRVPLQWGRSLPLKIWAGSLLEPIHFAAVKEGRELSRVQEFKLEPLSGFLAAAAFPPASLTPALAERLQELRRDLSLAPDLIQQSEGLSKTLEFLARTLLEGDADGVAVGLQAAVDMVELESARVAGRTVHLVGHAHIDMNWLWRWPETIQVCHDTFRQVLHFMHEYPDFRFTQSQASCYEAMEIHEPGLFRGIQAAVKDGRWNVVGGMWTEGDTNLSSGEALARSFLLAQRYFKEKLGVKARVGWLPDNFGHTAQLPQLLNLAGIQSFYHMRTGPTSPLYWWVGQDGSRVLAKTGQGYNDQVTASIRQYPWQVPEQVEHQLFVYGVGDHGGGPTRHDISTAKSFQGRRLFPAVRFSTADAYFTAVKPQASGLPVHEGELGYIFEGCYTNISAIKLGNRSLENSLQSAESLAVAAGKLGQPWPAAELKEAWKILAFNQFHDILPGSAVHESNLDTGHTYAQGLALAQKVRLTSLRQIASHLGTEGWQGLPLLVFNGLGWTRTEIVTAEIVVTDRFHGIELRDPEGRLVPCQVVRTKDFSNDFHVWIQFCATDIPAMGYKTYSVRTKEGASQIPISEWGAFYPEPPVLPAQGAGKSLARKGLTVRNRFFEASWNPRNGRLQTLKRITNGLVGPNVLGPQGANRLGIFLEKPHPMSAWTLDPGAKGPLDPALVGKVKVLQEGDESICLRSEYTWGRSRFWLTTTVHADSARIDCQLRADWLECGSATTDGPMLKALWQAAGKPRKLACDVPFATVEREAGREVPAQKWVDVAVPGGGLAIFNNSKYGHSLHGNLVGMSLLRSSYDPDIHPDLGRHEISWGLLAHEGDWLQAGLPRLGMSYNVPLDTVQGREHKGSLPSSGAFLEWEADRNFIVTGLKKAEDGEGLVIRGYDSSGKGSSLKVKVPGSVHLTDILEEPLEGASLVIRNGWTEIKAGPWKIVTVKID